MGKPYAVLLDGGFVTKVLKSKLGRFPGAADVRGECGRIQEHTALAGHRLLRIYWYDAAPATGLKANPIDGSRIDLGRTPQYRQCKALHDQLELADDFALRMGVLDIRGWRMRGRKIREVSRRPAKDVQAGDIELDISQKGVDLRIGLDIARLALRGLVASLVVVTGDSDLIPAFKFARREGVRVYLDHLGSPSVMRSLKVHVDRIL